MRRSAFVSLLPLTLLMLAAAPAPDQVRLPSLGETIDVSLVNVEVFVTDKAGRRISGLKRDDFEVLEDRKLQDITNFTEYGPSIVSAQASADVPADPAKAGSGAANTHRTIIIWIDRFQLTQRNRDAFFGGLRNLVDHTVRPGDAAMIISYGPGLRVRQPFTDQREALDRVLDAIAAESARPVVDDYVKNVNDEAEYQSWSSTVQQAAASRGASVSMGGSRPGLELSALQALYEIRQKVRALNAMIQSISGAEGKKVLFLASHRLSSLAGAESRYASGQIPEMDLEYRSKYNTRDLIDSVTRTANANGVTMYPVYPEGLTSQGLARADVSTSLSGAYDSQVMMNETPVLEDIAQATGGSTAWGAANIVTLLPYIEDDFNSYYSLAYRAATGRTERARILLVRTKNRTYVVRTRREAVEKSDESKMNDRIVANLFQPSGVSLIPLKIGARAYKPKAGRYTIPLIIQIPISALTSVPQGDRSVGAFSVYVGARTDEGTVGSVTHKTQRYDLPLARLKEAKAGHFTYDLEVLADAKTARLSIGVYDEVSHEYGLTSVGVGAPTSSTTQAR